MSSDCLLLQSVPRLAIRSELSNADSEIIIKRFIVIRTGETLRSASTRIGGSLTSTLYSMIMVSTGIYQSSFGEIMQSFGLLSLMPTK